MDTKMGFPCPFRSEVIEYFSPVSLFSISNPILMSFKLLKAQRHDAAAYGNATPITTLWHHRYSLAPPPEDSFVLSHIFAGQFSPQWDNKKYPITDHYINLPIITAAPVHFAHVIVNSNGTIHGLMSVGRQKIAQKRLIPLDKTISPKGTMASDTHIIHQLL